MKLVYQVVDDWDSVRTTEVHSGEGVQNAKTYDDVRMEIVDLPGDFNPMGEENGCVVNERTTNECRSN
jgi:hypothetical protein